MQRFPVTMFLAVGMIVLFLAVEDFNRRHPDDRLGGRSRYGAVSKLVIPAEPKLTGHFQLWGTSWSNGEWWRVLVSGFHHGGMLHLLFNMVGLVYLGRLLESRWGHARFLLFLLSATLVSLLPCFLLRQTVVGLSGGIYALFGLLVVKRTSDESLQRALPTGLLLVGILWIPVGMLLNTISPVKVSNLGHASGLIYGLLAGLAFFPPRETDWYWRWRFITPRVFLASHVLLLPALYFVTHPVWNARYHWYLATRTEGAERLRHLDRALERNPSLGGAWRMRAAIHWQSRQFRTAWEALFEGVARNPADEKMLDVIASNWKNAGKRERQTALEALRAVFPEDSNTWRRVLGLYFDPTVPPLRFYRGRRFRVAVTRPPKPPLPKGIDIFWPPVDGDRLATPNPLDAPPLDPDDPHSAVLGRAL